MNRLFRHITQIVMSGFILALTGCAYEDTVRDLREQAAGSQGLAIEFSNGIIDNPIRRTRAVTLLSDHTESMGVWGWQTTLEGVTERLFLNQEVTFSAPEAKWTYNPVKYWEKKSTYRFCAYAPHSGSTPEVTATIDSATHAISFKGVTLRGCNTIDSGVPEPPANFNRVVDTDWMLDRTGQSMAGIYRNEVLFNMQHILSKLCIRVRRSSTFLPDSIISMSIDSLIIGSFISQGDFTQAMNDSLEALAAEWTPVDTLPRYSVMSAKNVSVPDSAVYILESLFIPQRLDDSQYIRVWYSIGNAGGYINRFSYIFTLKNLLGSFDAGKNYVITVTIGPEPIRFDTGVLEWNSHYAKQRNINNQ